MLAGLAEDVRYALRMLRKTPGTTLAAMTALAFGIGFNAATYSSADVLVFRPILIPEIEKTFVVSGYNAGRPDFPRAVSPAEFQRLQNALGGKGTLAATRGWSVNLTGAGEPETVEGQRVSASFFDVTNMRPMLGRAFTQREEEAGQDRVAVLSHGLWERRFGRDPAAVGMTVQFDGAAYQVIGVMPEHFRYPAPVDFWSPLVLSSKEKAEARNFYLHISGRLNTGETLEGLNAQLPGVTASLRREFGSPYDTIEHRAEPLRNLVSGNLTHDYTMVMLGCVAFLLVIACTNVANLQLARMVGRRREISIRSALGAGRLRLIRQALVESAMLALGGLALGLVVAVWGIDLIKSSMPAEVMRYLPGWQRMGLNWHVLLWTMGATCVAGLLAGLAPALWMTRDNASSAMRESDRGSSGGVGRQRINAILVTSEVVLSLILLVGAALMARSLNSIGKLPDSIPSERLLTFRLSLPVTRYADEPAVRRFQQDFATRLRNLPGVQAAGYSFFLPYSDNSARSPFAVEGVDYGKRLRPVALRQTMDSGFLPAFGLRLIRGRSVLPSDGPETHRIAVINEKLAQQHFEGRDPIGRRIHWGDQMVTVVGVVEDVMQDFVDRAPLPTIYTPAAQTAENSADFVVRTAGDPMALMPQVRKALADLDPAQPLFQPRTMRKMVNDAITGISYTAGMLSVLGLVALLLSSVGVYSLMAWAVGQRTREIGVRLALGATPRHVMWIVLRRTILFVSVGMALGLLGSVAMARMLSGLVFGIAAMDLVTFTGVPAILLIMALIASAAPARRVLRTDPVKALHYE